jgi:hypothetical protein
MDGLSAFTVCDECYDAVVWPLVEGKSDVANNFIRKRQKLEVASCQLYSENMREVFRRACKRNDMGLLESKIKEKFELRSKLAYLLQQQNQEDPGLQKERADVIRRLREIE